MWKPKRAKLIALDILAGVLGPQNQSFREQCIWPHRLTSFIATFPNYNFDFEAAMPVIDVIDYKTEGTTKAYLFAPFMASKSTIAGNISVFEDLNINQIGWDKDDPRFNEHLILWWGDLKTEVQMLSMQALGASCIRAYDCYQYIFPGLALWHLQFNYLKMI